MKSLSYPHTHLRPSSWCSISEIIYRTPGFFEYLQGTGCDQFAVANSAHVDISCSTSTIITLKTVDLLADRRSFNKLDYRRSTTDTPAVYRISPIPLLRAVCLAKKALVAGFTFRLLLRPQSHKYKPTPPAYGKTIETSQDQNISHSQQKQKQLRKQSTIWQTGSTLGKGKKKKKEMNVKESCMLNEDPGSDWGCVPGCLSLPTALL